MAQGNNKASKKILRFNVPIVDQSNINGQTFGRYYFTDNPNVNTGIIVGMQAHASNLIANPLADISASQAAFINSKPIGNAPVNFMRSCLLTLINTSKKEVLSNFPLNQLFNRGSHGLTKIYPFFLKADLSKSYILFVGSIPPGLSYVPAINISFYLR